MEAPYLQKLTNALDPNKFIVLGVNRLPGHDPGVVNYFRYHNYTYLPLKAPSEEWNAQHTAMMGRDPLNFVLDQEGRLVFQPELLSKREYLVVLRAVRELIESREGTSEARQSGTKN